MRLLGLDRYFRRLFGSLERSVQSKDASEEEYVRMAYLVLLRRPIDEAGLKNWRSHIEAGHFNHRFVVRSILGSNEYLSGIGADVIGAIHRSRQAWIKTVPAFENVLDIGGSSVSSPEGALIELGYPHRPRRIDILDLPPDKQYWGKPKYNQSKPNRFDWGEVSYFHGGAEQIEAVPGLQDRIYDCVYLGQAIEHIYPEALPRLLAWIKAHLEPGGQLVFDTPNRLLTKIQCPDSLIDPDHKYEYTPTEMQRVMDGAGFAVSKKVGMVHLPAQAASGKYAAMEFSTAQLLSDDVDACYLFAFEASPL
jgi:SAM-dependent methyltransferase